MKKNKSGFTFIEAIVVMSILGVLGGISAAYVYIMTDTLGLQTRQADLQESSAVALSRMSRETRRLKDDASVVAASASVFTFTNINNVRITYQRNAGNSTLERVFGFPVTATDELADNVSAFAITYYDDNNAVIASPTVGTKTNIRRIEYKLTFLDGTHSLTTQTAIRPRNLRHESDLFF